MVIAAPASGHGKTTVATGLMAALAGRGHTVSGHKVGPDYIDPSYHALATGRPGRNLDPHLQGEHRIVPLLRHGATTGARNADIAVIEGVMGLFDGALGTAGFASTAHVARLTATPVILVVDASAAGRSVAAMVHGFATYDPQVTLAGVILNKIGSPRHEAELRSALDGIGVPVLGALHRSEHVEVPSRHLGLVPADERHAESAAVLDALRSWITTGLDLDAVVRVARAAPDLTAAAWNPADALRLAIGTGREVGGLDAIHGADGHRKARDEPFAGEDGIKPPHLTTQDSARPVVAAAGGRAFTFRYRENVELLEAAGVDVVDIDPLTDEALPDGCAGLYFGGGFPEVHAEALSANAPLRNAVAELAGAVPIVAECAGLTYLCRELDDLPMTGVLDATARMTGRRTLGYRTATAVGDNLLARDGEQVTAHEFHRTQVTPGHGPQPAWQWASSSDGFAGPLLHASYLHVHWAGHPHLALSFAAATRKSDPAS
ncbi:cobyrinate a,c-diamide synthase [Phytoactinopolyspora sp. XMNu-373]|uniref:Hydrogenobyrinate a,c-diamide synthase n=2 Tax=Phytoactinopolyspora mesophila TaxID=2650750 RepID=A0A7K3MAU2_9ACTN|nr:cobyrinate a,c-diamide synthase [Phytoactinopolyspora mesophila]